VIPQFSKKVPTKKKWTAREKKPKTLKKRCALGTAVSMLDC
jgi:hypothetical protein